MDHKKIFLLALGHMSCDVNAHALPALLPYLVTAHGFDYQSCGLLAFAYAAISSLIQPVLGLVSDRFACRWFIPLGVLIAGGSFGVTGFFSEYWLIFAALVLGGVGGALFHPEGARYANLVSGSQKGIGMSIFAVGGNMGMIVGPLFILLAVGGVHAGGITVGGFGLPGTAVFAVWGFAMSVLIYGKMLSWPVSAGEKTKRSVQDDEGWNDWHAFGILSGCILARASVAMSFTTYVPLYWHSVFHQPEQVGSIVLIFFCGLCIVSNLAGGVLADRWGYIRVIRFSSFVLLAATAIFPLITSPWLALLFLLPLAVAFFGPFSAIVVLGQRYLSRNMGLASGVTLGISVSLGGAFSPILGWVADNFGGLSPALFLFVPLSAIGAVCSCFLKDTLRKV